MKVHPAIRDALEQTGLPWDIINGGKHNKVRLAGHLAGILPRASGEGDCRSVRNTISQIRRKAMELGR